MDEPAEAGDEPAHKKARRADDESRFQALEKEQVAQGQQLAALNNKIEENKKAVDGVREQVTTLAERQHVATMQSGANLHNLGVLDKKARQVLKGYMKKHDVGASNNVLEHQEKLIEKAGGPAPMDA